MVIRDSISLAENQHKSENEILSNYYYYSSVELLKEFKLMHFRKKGSCHFLRMCLMLNFMNMYNNFFFNMYNNFWFG
jgi:hypothetical protein